MQSSIIVYITSTVIATAKKITEKKHHPTLIMDQSSRIVVRPLTACAPEPTFDRLETSIDDQLLEDDYNKDVWDEGGKSHCGYNESVHDTLMALGEKVYHVVGEPSQEMKRCMKGIGSYFMEMSYAVRDIQRGEFQIVDEDLEIAANGSNLSNDNCVSGSI